MQPACCVAFRSGVETGAESFGGGGATSKDADTCASPVNVTVQVEPVPADAHAPSHPANTEPLAAASVNVTLVPCGKAWLHVVPQSIPAGALVIEPLPAPPRVTVVSVGVAGVAGGAGAGGAGAGAVAPTWIENELLVSADPPACPWKM